VTTTDTAHQAAHRADQDQRRPSPTRRPDLAAVPTDTAAAEPAPQSGGEGFALRHWLTDTLRRYWTPPKLWTQPAASLDDLSAYAHTGEWTSKTGTLRSLGIVWWRAVGLPVTAVCRRIEWVAQRPGRFFAVLLLVELVIRSGPGHAVLHVLSVPLHLLGGLLT
jgi:hypothetical protein